MDREQPIHFEWHTNVQVSGEVVRSEGNQELLFWVQQHLTERLTQLAVKTIETVT